MELLLKISGQKNRMGLNRVYAKVMGNSIEGGVFIEEVMYWTDKNSDEDGWIWVDSDHWQEEYFLSKYLINKYAKIGVENGFIEKKVKKVNGGKRIHMKFNLDAFLRYACTIMGYCENFDNRPEKADPIIKNLTNVCENFDKPIYIDPLVRSLSILSDESEAITVSEKVEEKQVDDSEKQVRSEMRNGYCRMVFGHNDLKSLTGENMKAINAEIKRVRKNERGYTVEHMRYWWKNIWGNEFFNENKTVSTYQKATFAQVKSGLAQAWEAMNIKPQKDEFFGEDAHTSSSSKLMFDKVPSL